MLPDSALVNPTADFAIHFGSEVLAGSGSLAGTIIGELATVTLAALVLNDFRIEICEDKITPVNV